MRETNKVDLDDYVREEAVDEEEDDDTVKESAFDAFENWAEATEQGKLADDQIAALKQALLDLQDGQLNLDTAYSFFSEFGLDDDDLENKFQQAKELDSTTDPMQVFQLWAQESYPELLVALGMSGTQAPEQPMAENGEDRTSYQVAQFLFSHGITYDPAKEGELVKAIGMALVKELNMSPNQARSLINSEDFLGDTMSELQHMGQNENTDMDCPPGAMEEDKGSMVQEVAKIVGSFYNRDNPTVGPFRGEEGIALDVKKQIAEKFGEDAGEQAHQMAEAFIQKLTQEWQQKHGQVANGQASASHGDDGLARLKELLGNVKAKVEGFGEPEMEDKENWHPSKHVTDPQKKKELAPHDKDVQRGSYADRAAYLDKGGVPRSENAEKFDPLKHVKNPTQGEKDAAKDVKRGSYTDRAAMLRSAEKDGRLKSENAEMESILKLAGLAK
jgi:hypothetical protein